MKWEEALSAHFGEYVCIDNAVETGGGCINHAYRLETNKGRFFIKLNDAEKFPGMFGYEARGLNLLRHKSTLQIPEVLVVDQEGKQAFLILEYIPGERMIPAFWEVFGRGLAELHRNTHESFGLDHNNYIGSLPQQNEPLQRWPEFFLLRRMEPLLRDALDRGQIDREMLNLFNRFAGRVESLFPMEAPALLHGDLWSGNYMVAGDGSPCLIDPAVYYGHREMDLGMTMLFGGFDPVFYDAYAESFPLEPGWRERSDICNLYPLMVHVRLFGGGYAAQVRSILKRFI